jgi:hypothetical protein
LPKIARIDAGFAEKPLNIGTHNRLYVPGRPTFGIHVTTGGRFGVRRRTSRHIQRHAKAWCWYRHQLSTAEQDHAVAEAALKSFYKETRFEP